MRILFCGDCFPAARALLKERLPAGRDELAVCDGTELRKANASADVVIPLMTILDAELIEEGASVWSSSGARGLREWILMRHEPVAFARLMFPLTGPTLIL